MSRKPVVLVTGANGEMGHGLIKALNDASGYDILALDIKEIEPSLGELCMAKIVGDVLDQRLLERLVSEFEIHAIFHLAALLSTRAEFTPETAHEVNVTGTLNLLKLAVEQSRWHGSRVKFLFPSSIAVYGVPPGYDSKIPVPEHEHCMPTTMYGCNKLYCEHLGRYYAEHYRQLAVGEEPGVDFRCIRFPGLISAFTLPSGGTSDFFPEMVHAAAKRHPYACFVREDTRVPFMAMPDAIAALLRLMEAPQENLTTHVYNIGALDLNAGEMAELVRGAFPGCEITFEPDLKRQRIVDSWPDRVDDSLARTEWGYEPRYDLARTFDEYLLPNVKQRYA